MGKRLVVVIALASSLVLVGGAVGWGAARLGAGIPDAKGVVHGCYFLHGRNAGLLRVLPASDSCPSGQAPISWSQTGPPGPTGTQGPSGPQGTAGATGAAGKNALLDVTVRTGNGPDVMCAADEVAVGGGIDANVGNTVGVLYVRWSKPIVSSGTPTGWTGAPAGSATTIVYALCAKR
jgi:hypothetical protein